MFLSSQSSFPSKQALTPKTSQKKFKLVPNKNITLGTMNTTQNTLVTLPDEHLTTMPLSIPPKSPERLAKKRISMISREDTNSSPQVLRNIDRNARTTIQSARNSIGAVMKQPGRKTNISNYRISNNGSKLNQN